MILIVGAGAVGTALGHFLIQAGLPVIFLVRKSSASRYAATNAITLEHAGPQTRKPFTLSAPSVITRLEELSEVPDFVLLTTKQQSLSAVYDQLANLGTASTIAPCLNGVQHIQQLKQRFPQHTIAPISVNFNMRLLDTMHVLVTTNPQLYLYPDIIDSELAEGFASSGVEVLPGGSAITWGKLLINLNNAVGALTNSTFKDIFLQPTIRQIYLALLDEAATVLNAQNIDFKMPAPVPYFVQRFIMQHLPSLAWKIAKSRNGLSDESYPSMHVDLQQQRATEVDYINGEIVRLATPTTTAKLNQKIIQLIKSYNQPLSPSQLAMELGMRY